MIKKLCVVLILACFAHADEPKDKEKKLTELQFEKAKRIQAELAVAEANYRQTIAPTAAERDALIKEVCGGLGIPDDKVKAGECKVDMARGMVIWDRKEAPVPKK